MIPLSLKRKILLLLFFSWITLSFLSVSYNAFKSIVEVREWVPLSDTEKRQEIFGDLYSFFIFIRDHTEKNSNILIFSSDARTYYLGIYYLYPREIYSTNGIKELKSLAGVLNYDYIAIFNNKFIDTNYLLIEDYSEKNGQLFQLFKKK